MDFDRHRKKWIPVWRNTVTAKVQTCVSTQISVVMLCIDNSSRNRVPLDDINSVVTSLLFDGYVDEWGWWQMSNKQLKIKNRFETALIFIEFGWSNHTNFNSAPKSDWYCQKSNNLKIRTTLCSNARTHMQEWTGEDKSPQTRLILGFSIFIPPIRCARGVFHNFYDRRSHCVHNMTITGGAAEQLSN